MTSKILSALFALFVFTVAGMAQTPSSNPARDSVLNKMCDCITKSGKIATSDKAQEVIQECMMEVISADPMGVLMDLGLENFEDEAAAQKMGEKVGLDLIQKCPAMKEFTMMLMKEKMPAKTNGTTTGNLVKTDTDLYQYVILEENGKQVKAILLHYFTDAENLMKDTGKMTGKTITIQWKEVELWNPKTRAFEKHKEITGYSL